MAHYRNKLPMDHMFSVNSTIQRCKSISEVTMTLAKKRKLDIWQKQRFLRSLVGFWENVLSQHHVIRLPIGNICFWSRISGMSERLKRFAVSSLCSGFN